MSASYLVCVYLLPGTEKFLCTVPCSLSMPYLSLLLWGEPLNNPHEDYYGEFLSVEKILLPLCPIVEHFLPTQCAEKW